MEIDEVAEGQSPEKRERDKNHRDRLYLRHRQKKKTLAKKKEILSTQKDHQKSLPS